MWVTHFVWNNEWIAVSVYSWIMTGQNSMSVVLTHALTSFRLSPWAHLVVQDRTRLHQYSITRQWNRRLVFSLVIHLIDGTERMDSIYLVHLMISVLCLTHVRAQFMDPNLPVVTTNYGRIRGLVKDIGEGKSILSFIGIPFAAPPTRGNRFRVCFIPFE